MYEYVVCGCAVGGVHGFPLVESKTHYTVQSMKCFCTRPTKLLHIVFNFMFALTAVI